MRRVGDITGALWGRRVRPDAITGLNQKISERAEERRKRPLDAKYPCMPEAQNVPAPAAIGVSSSGFRELPGVEDDTPVTGGLSRFVPHFITP
ncbi:hypothetical protein [uncultured Desulfovibrio sp.]|uniref:hypothetical protein n=1 Tax=uncultured Desulfovibrio sp. TaxID=167968 RepID=UPI00039AD969|nr:hypothetical protein [uncultured Desulfovibrio sp.]